ncbi:MAG: hypothetical protein ABJP66_08115 [Hyphomicrobiales bacterium]
MQDTIGYLEVRFDKLQSSIATQLQKAASGRKRHPTESIRMSALVDRHPKPASPLTASYLSDRSVMNGLSALRPQNGHPMI